jgi:hypothetical protein
VAIHIRRTPPMPARRPFESDDNSLIGEPTKPTLHLRDPGGMGGDGML